VSAVQKLDRLAAGAIIFLLIASPMALGSVHPLAYRPLEATLFGLVIVWMAKRASLARSSCASDGAGAFAGGRFAVAIALFTGFAIFQMAPLPPSIIRELSPAAYRLYAETLEGWPGSAPYERVETLPDAQTASDSDRPLVILPTREQVQQGAPVPFAPGTPSAASSKPDSDALNQPPAVSRLAANIYGSRWRPISLAPLLTWSAFLALLSCASAFMFVAYYPFAEQPGSRSDTEFLRKILLGIIAAGLLVAFVGIIERATWNGKMLWFFVPYDWGQAMFEPLPRARGPFVNPDHFGGYLAMIFPLTLACALFPNLLTPKRAPLAFRIACGVVAFVILVAVLLSLSRGGWLGLAVGSAIMLLLATPRGIRVTRKTALDEKDPEPDHELQTSVFARSGRFRLALAGGAMVLAVALLFVGPDARFDAALRVQQSVSGDYTIFDRISAWKSGLALFRDFPVVGAGLGATPEIFPRYQLPPWSELYFNHAHNDYLELLAETGIVGIALFAWFAFLLIDRLRRGARWLTPGLAPAFAGVVGGIAAMCMIDLFDFDLRIPATAFLFSVLLGLAVRIGKTPASESGKTERRSRASGVLAFGVSLAALVLLVAAMSQGNIVYPYNMTQPQNLSQARALLTTYPANRFSHLSLLTLEGDAITESLRLAELERAVWTDPINPVTRDRYARALMVAGKSDDAIQQFRISVLNSPALQTHPYLNPRFLPWLPPAEKNAIEAGLVEAVNRGYLYAPDALGEFYTSFGRYSDAAKMYAEVAARERDPDKRADYLRESGEAYAHDNFAQAMAKFREAEDLAPDNSLIYRDMVTMVIGPHRDFELADKTIAQGIENGADPFLLWVALADASEVAFDRSRAESSLEQALKYQPNSFSTLIRLADLYLLDGRSDRAVATIDRALEIQPDSAALYSRLGQIEENRYHYYAAQQAYRRAAELAPDNLHYRDVLADFGRKLNAAAAAAPKSQAH
jgi:O-antigen ligase/tetratricopeptide (TPR) repeat protein